MEDASVKSMGEDELIERMYGDGRVGSKCRLTVQSSRSGEIRDVEVLPEASDSKVLLILCL